MKQKPTRQKLGDFMEGKGFYIVLFLCVAAIGISGYYLFTGLFSQPTGSVPETTPVSGQVQVRTAEDPAPQTRPQAEPAPSQDKPEDSTPQTTPAPSDKPAQNTADQTAAVTQPPAFVWPVNGEVQRDFSLEVFAYDDTMGDWRTHDGIDIAADLGSPVCSCAAGTVTAIDNDPMMGMTVTVDHGNGMESCYANLGEALRVETGSVVEAGTVLGCVGTTAISESAGESHLHFALTEYGVTIDPSHYLS